MKRKISIFIVFMVTTLYTLGAITVSKESNVATYIPGERITYIVEVTNDGNVNQEGISILDDMSSLPLEAFSSVTGYASSGGDAGSPSVTDGVFSLTEVVVGANGYVKYSFEATVSAGTTGNIVNTVTVSGTEISKNDTVTITELDQRSAVSIIKVSDVDEYDNGDEITYTIKVKNSSEKMLKNLHIKDNLSGLGFETDSLGVTVETTGTGSDGIISSLTGDKLDAAGAVLGPEGSITYIIKGTVDAVQSGDIINTAEVTVSGSKKTAIDTLRRTVYDYTADISVEGGSTYYVPGKVITYILKLENRKNNTIKGLNIADLLSSIEAATTDGTLPVFDMTATTVTATVTGTGSISGLSNSPLSGDLLATNAKIGPKGSIEYRIVTKVRNNVIGEIKNIAGVTETIRNNQIKPSNEVILSAGIPDINIQKSVDILADYLPGNTIKYTITVSNSGKGFGEEYTVTDTLSGIMSSLANSSSQAENSTDITGTPFDSGNIKLKSIGANSSSKNYSLTSAENATDLLDKVYIAPGESIVYEISAVTNPSAIGEIKNTAGITSESGYSKDSLQIKTTPRALNTNTDDIEVSKTTKAVEYQPGKTVIYDILIANKSDQFVNDFNLVDKINNIKAEQADGTIGRAFSGWTLNVIDPITSVNGTKPGTSIAGSSTTSDININLDIEPGKSVKYQLVAVVGTGTVGKIIDKDISGDNVSETGIGILMSTSQLNIAKTVNDTEYSPNETVVYTIIVENEGKGYALDVPVIDELKKIKSSTGVSAYSSWEITSKLESVSGSTLLPTGDSGIIAAKENQFEDGLNVTADIGSETRLIYTIKAVMAENATGWIQNKARADGTLVADKGIFPVKPDIRASKTTTVISYSGDAAPLEIVYKLIITNENDAGYAEGVKVVDILKNTNVELLDGSIQSAFESYSMSKELIGNGTTSSTETIVDGILTDTINITAGGSVVYTITAKVKQNLAKNIIPYGSIINTATITPVDIDGKPGTPFNVSAASSPKQPNLSIKKSTSNTNFAPGGTVNYTIRIDNNGEGYANNAKITDELLDAFSRWTIATETDSSGKGSSADTGSTIEPNKNIDVIADIAPYGWVEYRITAIVKEEADFSGDMINNTAKVTDTQSGNNYESSAKLTKSTNDGLYITKRVDSFEHIPGKVLTYTIDVFNTTSSPITDYSVIDKFSEIKKDLANDGTHPYTDIEDGFPFENMSWSDAENNDVNIELKKDFTITPTIPAAGINGPGKYTCTIKAKVKENVLAGRIKNTVIINAPGDVEVSRASVETNRGGDFGGISLIGSSEKYRPGEELVYTIVAKGGTDGYANNIEIKKAISGITTTLMDGSSGNPYYNSATGKNEFTVEVYVNDKLNGKPNSSGTSSPNDPADNTDINVTLDIAPGDEIKYVVKGKIRPDADGPIYYEGWKRNPYRHNLIVNKRTQTASYEPGKNITFMIEITNSSDGNAGKIDISDEISKLTTKLSNETTGSAFTPMEWTIETVKEKIGAMDYTSYADPGTYSNNSDINTEFNLPIDTRLTYKITGKVNPLAVGDIENTAVIEEDQTTGEIGSAKFDLRSVKTIEGYYDIDGTTPLTGGYKPGGWIEYLICMENTNGLGIINNLPVQDLISQINTEYMDGSTASAFSTWQISLDSSTTNEESTVPGLGIWDNDSELVLTDKDFVEGNQGNPNQTPDLTADEIPLLMDIAPGGKVAFRIKAKVDERAVGSIENIASIAAITKKSGKSEMLPADVAIKKTAYKADGSGNLTTTQKIEYKPGDTLYYVVNIKNNGDGISIGRVEDFLERMWSEIPESDGSGSNPWANPFTTWEVTAVKDNNEIIIGTGSYNDGRDNVTNLDNFESTNPQRDKNIDSKKVYIAPGGVLEYTIKATLKDNILTRISNVGQYIDQKKNIWEIANLEPVAPKIEVEKIIKYIGADPNGISNPSAKYNPEDYVFYEIKVKNTGESFGNNIVINDNLESIRSEVSGGGNVRSFESWEITDDGGRDSRTYIPAYTPFEDLNVEMDIAQGDTVTFTIKAKIKDNIIGSIPANTAIVKDENAELDRATSSSIKPKLPNIFYYKTLLNSDKSEIENFEYIPFGKINYKVVLENTGEGYGNDIRVRDILSNIQDEKNSAAFNSSKTTIKIIDKNGAITTGKTDNKTVITGNDTGINSLDVTVDIEPGARVNFYIEATVEGTATGDITNSVSVPDGAVPDGKKDEVTATLTTAEVTGIKTATDEYIPGGEIIYNIEIKNSSDSTADNIRITDVIKDITVKTADGNLKPAFKPGWSFTAVVEDDRNNSNISDLTNKINNSSETSMDNAAIILGTKAVGELYSVLKIEIRGTVIDDAVGKIQNNLDYTYNLVTTRVSATTMPKTGSISIKKTAITSKTDEHENNTYIPGKEKTFLIEVENTGTGYALDVAVEDTITSLLTKGAGNFSGKTEINIPAFSSLDSVEYRAVDSSDGVSNLTVVKSSDITTGFKGTVNIAPGDTFKIWITGTVNSEAIEDIENTVTAEYKDIPVQGSATINSADSDVTIKKEISNDGTSYGKAPIAYKPGDTIYYRISVDNLNGSGWANDVNIVDNISKILADQSGVGQEAAFESSDISIAYSGIDSKYIIIDPLKNDLEPLFDLPPKTLLTFDISGKVKNNITGQIDNSATFSSLSRDVADGKTNTVIAQPKDAVITILKEVVGGATEYSIGEEIHYRISVENTSDSFAKDLKIVDNIKGDNGIKTNDSIDPNPTDAFKNFNTASPILGNISKIISADYTNGVSAIVDLAPKDKIVFDIFATVTATDIGNIVNTASYEYNGESPVEKTVTLNSKKASLVIEKTSLTSAVIPGGEVTFRIGIENQGDGIANDVAFTDDLSLILTTLSDGTTDKAIKENSVTAKVIEPTKTTPAIPSIDITGNKVTSTLDIAPGGKVTVEIKGTLRDDIVGSITNTGKYEYINNGDVDKTEGNSGITIGAGNSDISIEKEAIVDPNLGGYIPGKDVEFRIRVHNNGPGIANNINIFDEMDGVMVETISGSKKAFSGWKIEVVDGGSINLPSFIPNRFPIEDSNLNVDVDIAPGDTLEFKITATVISDAFGDVINTARASYENDLNNDGLTEVLPVFDNASFIPSRSDVKIEKTEDKTMYAPGEEITYTITLTGLGPGIAKEVSFIDDLNIQAKTTLGLGRALEAGKSQIVSRELTGGATAVTAASIIDDVVGASLNIPRGGKAVYTIKTIAANNTVGKIKNTAKFTYIDNDGSAKAGEAFTNSSPINANLSITKTTDTEEFIAGNPITYTVKISNTGLGIADDVALKDLLMDIEIESVDGSNVKAFESVTITDNISTLSSVSSIESYDPNKNLDTLLDIAPGDTAEFIVVGVTNKLAGKDITNKAEYSFINNDGSLGQGYAEAASKIKLNEGKLTLTKQAFQKNVEKGGVVEYEILVRNTTEVYFTYISVEDKIPAGFKYVEDSTVMILSGSDGKFKTNDDKNVSDEPVKGSTLSYTAVNIGPKESLRIRYLLKASIGTTFGKYINTAYAVSGRKEVSNRDSATVEIIPDALFDTATIIGKIYEDFNGDGYQADATATKIELKGGVSVASYIPDSTTLEIDGKVESIEDASPPLQHGITIDRLRGVSRNRKIKEPNKAVLRYETIDSKWEPLNVTSKAGTQLYIDSDGNVTTNHKNDVKKGLANEKLKITRNVYRQKGKSIYLQEIVLENIGLYEDGIPGVRLITVDGIVIETDEFGRYHVPDEWVLRKNGKNFIIKVDEDSVPQGMQVISENPRVRRITPDGLNKFNFSVRRIEDDFDIGETKGIVEIGGNENE